VTKETPRFPSNRRAKRLPTRQRIRKALLFLSLLLFPITLYYFSPALIIQGAAEGIVTGSFIVFTLMFLSALFLGRLWCGWACPAGALQEYGASINNQFGPSGRWNWTKWAIWIPWVGLIAVMAIQAGGYRAVDPTYQIDGGAHDPADAAALVHHLLHHHRPLPGSGRRLWPAGRMPHHLLDGAVYDPGAQDP
jgi:hypothetical protein